MSNKLSKIVIEDYDDISFYFQDSKEPFSSREFVPKSNTRNILEQIEELIFQLNDEVKKINEQSSWNGVGAYDECAVCGSFHYTHSNPNNIHARGHSFVRRK